MYKTIVADPPWRPTLNLGSKIRYTNKAGPEKHYPTLSLEEICKFNPPSEHQAHLWLWVINQHIDWGYVVARTWGFEPINMITWHKPGLGVGRFQCNTEHCLICRKGSRHGNPFQKTNGTCFNWPRHRHSQKPDEFYQLVEQVSPGPYLEMFARQSRKGWDSFGNEIEESIKL